MNRVIEFNAWLPELGFMLEDVTFGHGQIGFPSDYEELKNHLKSKGFLKEDEYEDLPDYINDTGEDWWYIFQPEKYVLLEFTGLKDKTGKKIFEGHILDNGTGKYIGLVDFDHGCFRHRKSPLGYHVEDGVVEDNREGPDGKITLQAYSPEDWATIIGNIFHNPELLQDGKV